MLKEGAAGAHQSHDCTGVRSHRHRYRDAVYGQMLFCWLVRKVANLAGGFRRAMVIVRNVAAKVATNRSTTAKTAVTASKLGWDSEAYTPRSY